MKSCYFSIIVIHLHLKSAFCLREEFFSTFEKTSPPTHITHTHSTNRVLCFVKDNVWKKVFKDTFFFCICNIKPN